MNTDKPVIQENEQSALDDKTTFNDGPISSGNSTFCSFYCFLFCLYSETCIKVAEHSFRARTRIAKSDHFIYSTPALSVLFFLYY